MARFGAPHGVGGALRLFVFSRDPSFFLSQKQWWCRRRGGEEWSLLKVRDCRAATGHWLVTMDEIDDRTAAEGWCNGEIALPRSSFPETDRYYWCDLVGLRVLTPQDESLGVVAGVMDIGAHDVLRVRDDAGGEILIPFVAAHIQEVHPQDGILRADWQKDW